MSSQSRSPSPKQRSRSRSRDKPKKEKTKDRDRKNKDKDRDRRRRRSRSRSRDRDRSRKGNWDSAAPFGGPPGAPGLPVMPNLPLPPIPLPPHVPPSAPIAAAASSGGLLPTPGFLDPKTAKTVYIGNVQLSVTETHLRSLFPNLAIERITVNHEKFYAFVDFVHAADATTALALDGTALANYELRIRRPNNGGPSRDGPNDVVTPADGMYDESGLVALGPASQAKLSRRFDSIASTPVRQNSDAPYDY